MYKHFFKRFFDFWISLTALLVLSPILIVVTVWLHFANKGAGAFFTQERPGKDGKIFKVIKFKSMTDERDAEGKLLPDAQRLTKVGRFVRSTSIDELPQLINVLRGDMALIGPRPLLPEYLPYYTVREQLRHTVRPGISGWAQVNGRSSTCWDDKLEFDAYYAEHLSLGFDIKIIYLTVLNVIQKKDIEIPTGNTLVKERTKNNKKKLLILGSDFGTISVVKEAHEQGMYVIVADLMEESPTKNIADEQWFVSTTDIDLLEAKCRESRIDAVMFGASDFNISNCRVLCQRLNLPIFCEDDNVWNNVRDKRVFKTICKEVGAPIATDYLCEDDNIVELSKTIKFPVVVKPSDKSGNRGLSFCNSKEELINAYKIAREISDQSIIIERQLKGVEYNIHYLLANGEAKILYFTSTNHQPGYDSNLYSFKYSTEQYLDQYLKEVDEYVKGVFKAMSCMNGIAWVDAIRDEDGKFYLLEMGHRFGGVMTYVPYEKVSNFNTIKWMLDIACGIKHNSDALPNIDLHSEAIAASYHLFTTHNGIIGNIEGLEYLSSIDGIYIDIPKRVGASVRGKTCIGLIGIYGNCYNDLCSKVDIINSKLHILDERGHELIIKYSDYENIK